MPRLAHVPHPATFSRTLPARSSSFSDSLLVKLSGPLLVKQSGPLLVKLSESLFVELSGPHKIGLDSRFFQRHSDQIYDGCHLFFKLFLS